CRPVVDTATDAVATGASLRLVVAQCAARDARDGPELVRNAAAERRAAAAAERLVVRQHALQNGRAVAAGHGSVVVAAVARDPAADPRVHERAGRIAVSADGAVVANGYVPEGQPSGGARRVAGRRGDASAEPRPDVLVADAVPLVTVSAAGLVVLEE